MEATCLVCGSDAVRTFLTVRHMPVHCNLLWTMREGALNAPRGDIELGFCGRCGHIYNLSFDPDLMHYAEAYENSLHFSPSFQAYAESLATHLVERYDLRGKEIIEIGSGQGDFLRLLCALGDNRGLGFDPSYREGDPAVDEEGRVEFIQDFYSERYADRRADLVCCRHVLEHLEDPATLLAGIHRALQRQPGAVLFFEVPNALSMLRDLAVWDIIYEHPSYFGVPSLAYLFTRAGFEVLDLYEAFAGQYLCMEARPAQTPQVAVHVPGPSRSEMAEAVSSFGAVYQNKVDEWGGRLDGAASAGQKVVVWGAGSKGVTFLNLLCGHGSIEYVVDVNPRKWGMFVAGTGQKILPPDALDDYRPDLIIVMNRVYESEIRGFVTGRGLVAESLCA
jgi:SAM-dependent methyltransferase